MGDDWDELFGAIDGVGAATLMVELNVNVIADVSANVTAHRRGTPAILRLARLIIFSIFQCRSVPKSCFTHYQISKKTAQNIMRFFVLCAIIGLHYSFKINVIFNTTLYNVTLPLVISIL